jgi:hypothetical protein
MNGVEEMIRIVHLLVIDRRKDRCKNVYERKAKSNKFGTPVAVEIDDLQNCLICHYWQSWSSNEVLEHVDNHYKLRTRKSRTRSTASRYVL